MTSSRSRNQKGFTLLEIMVALAVLALSGIALLANVNQATQQLSRLDEKVVALSLAEYTLNTILLEDEFPETGSSEEIFTLSDREWRVEVTISETPNEDVRRIDTLVSPYRLLAQEAEAASSSTTVLLTGFQTKL